MNEKRICLVAIVRDEERFIEEWLLYHRMLGIDHFYIYDDDPAFPLNIQLKAYAKFVTVINWHGQDTGLEGVSNLTKAYTHALETYIRFYQWVAFIDADEFIVLPGWDDHIGTFLDEFDDVSVVSLNWHVFGHNGYYDDPQGLITASLTRRMLEPSINSKSITKTDVILSIISAHFCHIKSGFRVDPNHKNYKKELYEGITHRGYINHYQSRSFTRWMSRVHRGDAIFRGEEIPDTEKWRVDKDLCLKQFVTTVARNKNEHIDRYMLKFKAELESQITFYNNLKSLDCK